MVQQDLDTEQPIHHPITALTHRTERRFSWIILGLLMILLGGGMMLNAIQAARLRRLICERMETQPVTCQVQLVWLGVILRERSVQVQGGEIDERAGTYRLLLVTADGMFPFSDSHAEAVEPQAMADRINHFLQTEAVETLSIQAGGALQQLPVGIAGSILAAVGFFLTVVGYRIVVRPTHTNVVSSLVFSPDGQLLATASWDKTIHLWHVAEQVPYQTLSEHTGPIVDLLFSPDGQWLITASWDQTIRRWGVTDGVFQQTVVEADEAVVSLALTPDGQILAAGFWQQPISLWRVADGTLLRTLTGHEGPVESLAFTPDGQRLVSGSADRTARLWQVADGICLRVWPHPEAVTCIALAPEGDQFASGSTDHVIRLWSMDQADVSHTLTGHTDWIRQLAFMPDGKRLISASTDQTLRLWSVVDGLQQETWVGHTGEVTSVTVAPDGQLVASGAGDQMVRLWKIGR